jgi:hypothetical protein
MSGAHTDLLAVLHVGQWPSHWLGTPHGIEGAESGLGRQKGKVRAVSGCLVGLVVCRGWGGSLVACVQSMVRRVE